MIYRLQRKFILISALSVLTVITLVFGTIFALNLSSMNKNLDFLADAVSDGGGRFPSSFGGGHRPGDKPPAEDGKIDFITPETPFATRHFTVFLNSEGEPVRTNTEAIYSITDEIAVEYAKKAIDSKKERGWLDNYRYKMFETAQGTGVVFIDGSVRRSSLVQSMTIAGFVLLGCAALVLILIALLSKRAVKPIAESYEKQKQFITDANHELKTPLTLILANLDIAEAELGKNEWLDDIRSEGHRMTELVNQLVALSRMDEEGHKLNIVELAFGRLVSDALAEFEPLARERGKVLSSDIDKNIVCMGDEALLFRLVGILMDNAVKYCDNGGEIKVTLSRGRRVSLTVENTYSAVGEIELSRLFDRFYRADKARKFTGGYGVGLSMAKSIAEKHKAELLAYKKDSTHIGFKLLI
ncbi:MAG: HAMP domain-containing histidine kinase [Ruminococcaceae bacterium]|nr:HAMP domain-containing histidine kinase [Oscillospiraceae bacterium]